MYQQLQIQCPAPASPTTAAAAIACTKQLTSQVESWHVVGAVGVLQPVVCVILDDDQAPLAGHSIHMGHALSIHHSTSRVLACKRGSTNRQPQQQKQASMVSMSCSTGVPQRRLSPALSIHHSTRRLLACMDTAQQQQQQ